MGSSLSLSSSLLARGPAWRFPGAFLGEIWLKKCAAYLSASGSAVDGNTFVLVDIDVVGLIGLPTSDT